MLVKDIRYIIFGFLTIVAALPGTLAAQSDSKKGLSPLQVAQLQQVEEMAVSPSGKNVAYTVSKQADPLESNEKAEHHLYLLDLTSGNSVPFVKTMDVSSIAYRPQKEALTFLGKRENAETNALFAIPLSGGTAKKLFSFPTSIAGYSWAPDGNHLTFMAPDTLEEPDSTLPYEPQIYEENLKQRRGFVTNIAKKEHQPHQIQVEGSIYQMRWSPDGKRLAIAVAPTPKVDDFFMSQQVMIIDHRGENVFGTVDHRGKLGAIEWSPDGSKIAMLAAADVNDPVAGRLLIASSQGGQPTQLQPQYKGMFEQFAWIDSTTLRYLTSERLWSTYGTINADGTNKQTIVDRGGPNLEHFEPANDSTIVFIADSSAHPRELYRYHVQDSSLTRLTNNNKWLNNVSLGNQKAVSWKAKDGTELQGILVYPLGYEQGERYPLITTVHGGPEAHYNNGWVTGYSNPGQVAAADGFFVFYPNYRGSTGRGEAFAKSSQADMAGAEFDDIMAGVDELVDGEIADSSRIGVTGGSYGGYATGWMATRYTDRFAAGVMFVGISNNISKWGTSDIPEELFLVHARERIWEDYGSFLKRSPVWYAGQAATPLLIMAGKEDTRVDPSQSKELYRHIKTRTDTPVRLVLYPGEGHGNENATARYDYNVRMMRWFNTYLKGEDEDKELPDTVLMPEVEKEKPVKN